MNTFETYINGNSDSQRKLIDKSVTQRVYNFFDNLLPNLNFESRAGQFDMALDICEAIRDNQHIIIEAGVGIGKSYAYLAPVLYYINTFNKPAIISTSTISLQEQLLNDISKVNALTGLNISTVLAKGANNFVCKKRAKSYFDINDNKKTYKSLYSWIFKGCQGDRALSPEPIEDNLWNRINVDICSNRNCDFHNLCLFINLRNEMIASNGIILCTMTY